MNGGAKLLQSRRFWTMIVGIAVALILYFAGRYFGEAVPDVRFVIDLIVPLALMIIAAYTIDDAVASVMEAQRDMHTESLAAASHSIAKDREIPH